MSSTLVVSGAIATAPELQYLQAKWASLMSYGLTVDLLEEVLPIQVDSTRVIRHACGGRHLAAALGEEHMEHARWLPRRE